MKNTKWRAILAGTMMVAVAANAQDATDQPQPPAPVPTQVSPGAAEVVKLAEAGSSDDVILAYIQNSQAQFALSADGVIYLKDLGLSPQVVAAMLNHDTGLRNQQPQYNYDQKLYAPTGQVAPPPISQPAVSTAEPPPQPAVETPAPEYVSSAPQQVNYFYNDLSPYGSWVSLEGYGWCWQPSTIVINHGWRPYCDGGHWVWTDAGWFWQSDYSWGWAPFHYGRWYMHPRCGWVWTPDTVWAPAWVTWRVSGDHCGWAPLPPHADFDARLGFRFNGVGVRADFDFGLRADNFTFIAFGDFNRHDLGRRRLPPAQVTTVFKQTTIVNNYSVNNKTIVNRGFGVDRVSAATHTTVKTVAIRDVSSDRRGTIRTVGAKNEAVVYRPELKAPARPVHAVAQQLDDRHPVVQHTEVRAVTVEHKTVVNPTVTMPGASPHKAQIGTPQRTTPEIHQPATTAPQRRETLTQPVQTPQHHEAVTQPTPPVQHHETAPQSIAPQRRDTVTPAAKTPTPAVESPHQSPSVTTHIAPQTPPVKTYSSPQRQNPQFYQPKGYYQFNQTHMSQTPAQSQPSGQNPGGRQDRPRKD